MRLLTQCHLELIEQMCFRIKTSIKSGIATALLQKSDDQGFTSRIHGVRRGE